MEDERLQSHREAEHPRERMFLNPFKNFSLLVGRVCLNRERGQCGYSRKKYTMGRETFNNLSLLEKEKDTMGGREAEGLFQKALRVQKEGMTRRGILCAALRGGLFTQGGKACVLEGLGGLVSFPFLGRGSVRLRTWGLRLLLPERERKRGDWKVLF